MRNSGPQPGEAPDVPMVIVLMGVAGCGKTTTGKRLSRLLGWPFRDADSFHPPANIEKMSRGIPLTDEDRGPWLAAIRAWIDAETCAGNSAIVSCSALRRTYREVLTASQRHVRIVHLTGSRDLIASRMERRRNHFMPPSLLASQFATLEPPTTDERAVCVSVLMPPGRVVSEICERLQIAKHLGRGG
jgi:carbohydrate kinase (thermoresistant glucokinase family)